MTLEKVLVECLRDTVWDPYAQAATARCVLVGPPDPVLDAVFGVLTGGGVSDWILSSGVEVPIVLVTRDGAATEVSAGYSAKGTWDYALNMRDTRAVTVVLASRSQWDRVPESISNASVVIGEPTGLDFWAEPWASVIRAIVALGAVDRDTVRTTLKWLAEERRAPRLSSPDPHWDFAAGILGGQPYAYAAGVPFVPAGGAVEDFSAAVKAASGALKRIAERIADYGLEEASKTLTDAAGGVEPETDRSAVVPAVREMVAHIGRRAGSGLGFEQAPHSYFRPSAPSDSWWLALRASTLDQLVPRRPKTKATDRLETVVREVVVMAGSVSVVQGTLTIDAKVSGEGGTAAPLGAQLTRRGLTSTPFVVAKDGASASVTDAPPQHNKPWTYRVAAGDLAAVLKIVSLNTYRPCGLLLANSGERVELPVEQKDGTHLQDLRISQSGDQQLTLLAATNARTCLVSRPDETTVAFNISEGRGDIVVALSHQDVISIVLKDAGGGEIGGWTARALIEGGSAKAPKSEWERLLRANLEKSTPPRAESPYTPIRELEARLLLLGGSDAGVIGCWSDAISGNPGEFDTKERIGDIHVPDELDPRPAGITPPEAFRIARAAVFEAMRERRQPIPELDVGAEPLRPLVTAYASAYLAWVRADRNALWAETVSMFVRTSGQHGTVSTQPVAILIPPTHPLKLAWHANAQRVLRGALDANQKCPLASALDPGASPSAIALELRRGDTREARTFVAAPSGDPYWGLLINARDIANRDLRGQLNDVLGWLRLAPEDVAGGLSAQHTTRALEEILAMTPTRALLRAGIVSAANVAGPVADAVLAWAVSMLAISDADQPPLTLPVTGLNELHVLDYRRDAVNPSPTSLADAGDRTGERVLWMRDSPEPVGGFRPDLTLMEDIELSNHELVAGEAQSVVGSGGLARVDIRDDPGDATWVSESRTAARRAPAAGEDALSACVGALIGEMEAPAPGGSPVQLRFEPNQQLLKDWVGKSVFVAASSTQLDPACFVRGAHSGLLWDFDIPVNSPDAAGYYLIAGRNDGAAEAAVRRGLDLAPEVAIGPVLDEVSRRGIPILRRIAAGGNQARGELGMLLGARLLQDAFRMSQGELVLPPVQDAIITMLLPVDPYQAIFESARRELLRDVSGKRADLLVITVAKTAAGVAVDLRPVEVKNRPAMPAAELRDALTQAETLGRLAQALWEDPPRNELWDQTSRICLARCIDHAFRLYADADVHGLEPKEWREMHQATISAIFAAGDLANVVHVSPARLLAFRDAQTSEAKDLDGDGALDTLLVSAEDRVSLLGDVGVTPSLCDITLPLFARAPSVARTGGHANVAHTTEQDARALSDGDTSDPSGSGGGTDPDGPRRDGSTPDGVELAEPTPDLKAEVDGGPAVSAHQSPAPTLSPPRVTPEARARVKQAFAGFIGNEAAVEQVTRDLLAATLTKPPRLSRNILFVGPPSVGKTEIARRIARALALPFLRLDGPSLQSRDRLFKLLDEQLDESGAKTIDEGTDAGATVLRYPPFVVFVDEVHLVARPAQESLLTLLEPRDRQARIGNRVVRVPDATFLFATTRPQRIDNALKSRCVQIDLEPYNADQVAQMIRERVAQEHPDITWGDEVFVRLANLSRLIPRAAFELAEDLWKEVAVSELERPPLDHLRAVQRGRNIDDRGLRPIDFRYLTILERATGPIGEESLATQLGIDRDQLFDTVEPMLIRMNLAVRGRSGREITLEGRAYLAEYRLGDAS
jgi:Holliday junction resolvasome RuvABC ATP-dependent DNA helicase subunit